MTGQLRRRTDVEPSRTIESPYLTTDEAVDYLRLSSAKALYHLIASQRLPHLRRGRRLLFDRRGLDAWLRGFDSSIEMARAGRER